MLLTLSSKITASTAPRCRAVSRMACVLGPTPALPQQTVTAGSPDSSVSYSATCSWTTSFRTVSEQFQKVAEGCLKFHNSFRTASYQFHTVSDSFRNVLGMLRTVSCRFQQSSEMGLDCFSRFQIGFRQFQKYIINVSYSHIVSVRFQNLSELCWELFR